MNVTGVKQLDVTEKPFASPLESSQVPLVAVLKEEISQATREKAEGTILSTLGIESNDDVKDFDEKLQAATKSLSIYQQLEEKLKNVERKNLPYELFNILKKDADSAQVDPSAPKDGVLIASMRQGRLECAGRTLIASTFLKEHGIAHTPVSAPGHAFMIIELFDDTLAYFDANNNLFFTFPKSALEGYQGTQTSAECRLKEYTPRSSDFSDGITTVYNHFIAMPQNEGIGRQYLGNIAAALAGNEEFETSGIEVDKAASEAVHQIESETYGENEVYDSFLSRMEVKNEDGKVVDGLLMKENQRGMEARKNATDTLRAYPDHDEFVLHFAKVLDGPIGDKVPYIKNATPEQKTAYAEKVWEYLKK